MAYEVFICYSSQDVKIAENVCSQLENNGISCWIAPRNVPAGKWGGAIMEAVSQCHIMVLIFSISSNKSANCLSEVHAAFSRNKKIIPLRLDNTVPSEDMEYYLQTYHWLDIRTPALEAHLQGLVDRVKAELTQEAAKIKREAEESARKAREAEEQARREAEEREKSQAAAKARQAAAEAAALVKAQKEAEEAVKAKQQHEAEIAEANRKAEEAKKAKESAIQARKEAEEAIKEKNREQAEASRAKKQAEYARKATAKTRQEAEKERERQTTAAREADIKAQQKVEKEKERQEANAKGKRSLKQTSRDEGIVLPGPQKKLNKAKVVWLSTGSFVVFAALVYGLFILNPWQGTEIQKTSVVSHTPAQTKTVPPIETTPMATMVSENLSSIGNSLILDYATISFNPSTITPKQLFNVIINGTLKCMKDLPGIYTEGTLTANITARLAGSSSECVLNPAETISIKPLPSKKGETAVINEIIWLQFPEDAQQGKYDVKCNINSLIASDNLYSSYELTSCISPLEKVIGQLTCTGYWISGYVRDSKTNTPVSNANIYVIGVTGDVPPNPSPNTPTKELQSTARTDNNGYYKTLVMTVNGPYLVSVIASGYEQMWYDNVTDKTQAKQVTITALDKIQKIDFSLVRGASISGKVTDVSGKPLAGITISAQNFIAGAQAASAITIADGSYVIVGITPGAFRIQARPSAGRLSYADKYYKNTRNMWDVQQVIVNKNQETPGIDFSLDPAGTISGKVTNSDGSIVLTGITVECSSPTSSEYGGNGATTDIQGNYTIYGVPYGNYLVRARSFSSDYCLEYYPEKNRMANAQSIKVAAGSNPVNINFTMEAGGTISGKVISELDFKPIANCILGAWDYTTGEWLGSATTNSDGTYTFHGLTSGGYKVGTASGGTNKLPYYDKFYYNVTTSDAAKRVDVIVGRDTPNINFSLAPK